MNPIFSVIKLNPQEIVVPKSGCVVTELKIVNKHHA
jgi:hypothetical protein